MVNEPHGHAPKASSDERWNALEELDEWLRTPMLVLSFLWLLLVVVVELVWGTFDPLETFGVAIWIAFLIEFSVRFALAPEKTQFLSRNWLTVVALIVPAFRLLRAFRILRFTRAARGLRLVRLVGTANRGTNALRASLSRRGLGYVTGLTVVVALLGSGGRLASSLHLKWMGDFRAMSMPFGGRGCCWPPWGPNSCRRRLRAASCASCSPCMASLYSAISLQALRPSSLGVTPLRSRARSQAPLRSLPFGRSSLALCRDIRQGLRPPNVS
jgi:hypothetical protein